MAEIRNQIVGLVRFSYLSDGGFSIDMNPEDQAAFLFDPARLERRFRLFEQTALPSLLRQSDQDFICIFLVSDLLPDPFLHRLAELVKPLKGAIVIPMRRRPHYSATLHAFDLVRDETSDFLTSFRLDDDDMLEDAYIARLKKISENSAGLVRKGGPLAIAFNAGIYLEIGQGGNKVYDVYEKNPLGIGAAMMTRRDETANIFAKNHRLLSTFFTTVSDVSGLTWIRTVHKDNDSEPNLTGSRKRLKRRRLRNQLQARFGIDLAELEGRVFL